VHLHLEILAPAAIAAEPAAGSLAFGGAFHAKDSMRGRLCGPPVRPILGP
jgi:hypothetical protein